MGVNNTRKTERGPSAGSLLPVGDHRTLPAVETIMWGIYSPISKNERGQSQMRRDQLPSSKETIPPITFLKPICTSTFKKAIRPFLSFPGVRPFLSHFIIILHI